MPIEKLLLFSVLTAGGIFAYFFTQKRYITCLIAGVAIMIFSGVLRFIFLMDDGATFFTFTGLILFLLSIVVLRFSSLFDDDGL
jgi:uncharacterized membrane protein (UPF0136 family)